ncbi:cell wall hydrolase [Jiella avicenniae]|uniref:Cell wall hydrolase n=1 Tax=Jiella avicenniae TaxID=2907202 RepID=A0A9X1P1J8_9HYPH|nr:cell wall hydrolase [Jiella avicenniae]MCE7027648.1 cell wall hydrolase [Jiella avicenniae]MCE7028690.1 cell wall hydrolase [Jiella avicenniae]
MISKHAVTTLRRALAALLILPLAGCIGAPGADEAFDALAARKDFGPAQECLARAMYFESNRSSEDGMLAVGTVVMNRVASSDYPDDVCQVVGQPNQFAPGVMTREMRAGKDLAMKVAYRVLDGERHKGVAQAKYFHTAGMNFPYRNMSYRLIAGGNAFYEKVSRRLNPEARIVSQAEVRQAQNAGSAIDLMRTASTRPQTSGGSSTAIGYAEPRGESGAPVPHQRPAEVAATKSPFLDMFRTRQRSPAGSDERQGRAVETAAAGESSSSTDLPGVDTRPGLADDRGSAVSATTAKETEDWLRRW